MPEKKGHVYRKKRAEFLLCADQKSKKWKLKSIFFQLGYVAFIHIQPSLLFPRTANLTKWNSNAWLSSFTVHVSENPFTFDFNLNVYFIFYHSFPFQHQIKYKIKSSCCPQNATSYRNPSHIFMIYYDFMLNTDAEISSSLTH